MRVYLAATMPALQAALAAGEFGPAPLTGFAVTPALRESYASGDEEELEYAAMAVAARTSLRLLAADAGAPPRRVAVAADVPDTQVKTGSDLDEPAAVTIAAAIPRERIVSAHVDDPDAAADVRAAVAALAAADLGDDDARFTVDGAEGNELLWYAVQELPYLFE